MSAPPGAAGLPRVMFHDIYIVNQDSVGVECPSRGEVLPLQDYAQKPQAGRVWVSSHQAIARNHGRSDLSDIFRVRYGRVFPAPADD